ncbi:MAG: alginate export family protein [Desulfobulbaceae bacterium]|nr:alginate export family protein [Desulfobulbaceae bacterium]
MLEYRAFYRIIIILLFSSLLPLVVPENTVAQKDYLHAEGSAEETKDKPAPKQPGPIPRARWSEDWSTIGDPAPLVDTGRPPSDKFWRPFKYIPLNESGESYLSFGGESRLAYEIYDDKDMGISDIGYQDALQLRLALHADLHLNRRWRIFSQLGYGEVLDSREGGEKTADETDIDIWELFIDYRLPVRDDERVVFRLGRQLIETGNLFINAGEGNNVRQVYDGLRVGWIANDFIKFGAFAVEYVDFDDDSFGMSGTGEYFWGFRTGMRLQQPELDLHFLYTGWDLKDRQFEQGGAGRHDEQRHSLLFQLNRPLTGTRQWGLGYYLAYQFGEYEDQPGDSDISAFAGFGEVKYAVFQQANTPILGFKTAYFSGDSDPDDNELNTFYDPVFATPFFGYARDIQPHNLIFIQPNVGYRFGDRKILVTLSHGFHWRADTSDAFYGSPNGITARAGVSDSSWLGQQTQLAVRYLATPNLLITSYLARFFAGDMIQDAGGSDRDYFHIGIHYLF